MEDAAILLAIADTDEEQNSEDIEICFSKPDTTTKCKRTQREISCQEA